METGDEPVPPEAYMEIMGWGGDQSEAHMGTMGGGGVRRWVRGGRLVMNLCHQSEAHMEIMGWSIGVGRWGGDRW